MLSTAALLAVTMAAAAVSEPITGAFGLTFGEPVPDTLLGASIGDPPYPDPPANLRSQQVDPPADARPLWYLFTPQAFPERLDTSDTRFLVLVDGTFNPVRIVAQRPSADCAEDLLWFTRSLARKYGAAEDPFGAERAGFDRSARFASPTAQVDVSCGPRLLVEYTDVAGFTALQAAWTVASGHEAETRAALERAAERVAQQRLIEYADTFVAGDRFRVDGIWGVGFGLPFTGALPERVDVAADEPMEIRLDSAEAPFDAGRFTLTLSPEREPITLTGVFEDPSSALFQQVSAAFQAKYGAPMKDTAVHKIFKINGDYLVTRRDVAQRALYVTFIDSAARRAQRERMQLAQQRALDAELLRFQEETAGL
ncbi:MAG: hypothetical protein R3E86_21760 [Pseudomonadales bacterium]